MYFLHQFGTQMGQLLCTGWYYCVYVKVLHLWFRYDMPAFSPMQSLSQSKNICSWNPNVREQNRWSSANPIQEVAQIFGGSIMMRLCACMNTRCWWQINVTNLSFKQEGHIFPARFPLCANVLGLFNQNVSHQRQHPKQCFEILQQQQKLFDQKRSWALKRLSTSVGLVCQCRMLARGPTQDANGISSYWDVLQQQS